MNLDPAHLNSEPGAPGLPAPPARSIAPTAIVSVPDAGDRPESPLRGNDSAHLARGPPDAGARSDHLGGNGRVGVRDHGSRMILRSISRVQVQVRGLGGKRFASLPGPGGRRGRRSTSTLLVRLPGPGSASALGSLPPPDVLSMFVAPPKGLIFGPSWACLPRASTLRFDSQGRTPCSIWTPSRAGPQ